MRTDLACLLSRKLLQSTTAPAPARALLQKTLGRTPLRLKKALEEGSSTALLQSTQTALIHASTTRSTDAAGSSDDSAFLCGFQSAHVSSKNKAVMRHHYY